MAKEDEEILDDEKDAPKKKGNLLKIMVIVLSVIILIAASIGGTLFLMGGLSGGGSASNQDEVAASDGHGEVKDKEDKGDGHGKKSFKETFYHALEPPFIVNYYDGKKIRYLQVTVEVMTYDESVIEDVKKHTPVIRNNLILMLSNIDSEVISSIAGKKKLINDALAEIRGILEEKTGKPGVEEVYFTGFVMQ